MAGLSRRSFLKGGAVFAVGAAAATALPGCASPETGSAPGEKAPSAGTRPHSVHEFDVVVVGSGLAGLTAARRALDEGRSVAIVDKGQYGHSGASGINWGHACTSLEYNDDTPSLIETEAATSVFIGDGMVDQEYAYSLTQAFKELNPLRTAVQMGCVTEHTKEGKPVSGNTYGTGMSPNGSQDAGVFPHIIAQYVKRKGVAVFDYTFALDILTSDDGSAAGIAAVDLNTGEAKVFRAKAVVMATGSYVGLCGWNGMTPYTHGSQDNTGDGSAMFLRAGLAMRDMEELCYDNGQYAPKGTRQCMSGMGVEITDHYRGFNNNYEMFSQPLIDDPANHMNQGTYMRLEMREIWQGRGTEHGGIWALTDGLEDEERYYRNAKWNMKRVFDWDLPQYVELIPQCWETAGRPFTLDPQTSQTEIPGLFYAGSATFVWTGSAIVSSMGGGWIAGKAAADLAGSNQRAQVRPDQVDAIFDEAYAPLERQQEGSVRARSLMRNVQTGFWDGMYFLRDEQGIQGTIDELTRLREEELPRMATMDKSPQFNLEWKNALEARNMIEVGIGAAQAALIRKESRGAHCRTDYPKVDNASYMANTKVALANGSWSAELVDAGGMFMDHDTLVASIPTVGLE